MSRADELGLGFDTAEQRTTRMRDRGGSDRARWPLAGIAAGAAVICVVAEIVGVWVAIGGDYVLGEVIGRVLIFFTAVPVILGLGAVVLGRGRTLGALAALVGIIANPLVLNWVLETANGWFGGA